MTLCGWEDNLASHWPCVTGLSGLSTHGLSGLRKGDEHPAYAPLGYGTFILSLPATVALVQLI